MNVIICLFKRIIDHSVHGWTEKLCERNKKISHLPLFRFQSRERVSYARNPFCNNCLRQFAFIRQFVFVYLCSRNSLVNFLQQDSRNWLCHFISDTVAWTEKIFMPFDKIEHIDRLLSLRKLTMTKINWLNTKKTKCKKYISYFSYHSLSFLTVHYMVYCVK